MNYWGNVNLLSVPYTDKAAKEYKDLLPQERRHPAAQEFTLVPSDRKCDNSFNVEKFYLLID